MKIMFKKGDNGLINLTDESRIKFRTSISNSLLEQLKEMADQNNTYVNYLLENGMQNLLKDGVIIYDKKTRPKDRIQYKTSYDKNLLASIRKLAKEHDLFINDVIEYSTKYIDLNNVKKRNHRYRVVK